MSKNIPHFAYLASDVFMTAFYKTFKKNVEYIQEKLGSYSKTEAGVIDPIGNPEISEEKKVPVFLRNAGITAYMKISYFDEPEQLLLTTSFFFDKHDSIWVVMSGDYQKKKKRPYEKNTQGCSRVKMEYFDLYLKQVKKFMESGNFDKRSFPNKMNEGFVYSKIKKDELVLKKKLEEYSIPSAS